MKVSKLSSKKLAQVAVSALEDLKGQSVKCINVENLTQVTDYMVVATGRSSTHIKALANEVVEHVEAEGGKIVGIEGKLQSEWVLVDAGDVVVHIMMAPVRALYNLEELWNFDADKDSESSSDAAP